MQTPAEGRVIPLVVGQGTLADLEAIRLKLAVHDELFLALRATLERYVALAESGDCGFWDPEKEPHVIASRAVLAKVAP